MQVPQTLLGTSIATAILPTLSELFSNDRFDALKIKIERTTQVMLALTIPVAIIAGVVLFPAISAFLGLNELETMRVVDVSRIFLLGIVGHSVVELFVRSFYSVQQPRYPLTGAVLTLVLFIILGIALSPALQARGIAWANTLAYTIQAIFLLIMLNGRLPAKLDLLVPFLRALGAALLGGAVAFVVLNYLPRFAQTLIGAALAAVIGLAIAAVVIRKELIELRQL